MHLPTLSLCLGFPIAKLFRCQGLYLWYAVVMWMSEYSPGWWISQLRNHPEQLVPRAQCVFRYMVIHVTIITSQLANALSTICCHGFFPDNECLQFVVGHLIAVISLEPVASFEWKRGCNSVGRLPLFKLWWLLVSGVGNFSECLQECRLCLAVPSFLPPSSPPFLSWQLTMQHYAMSLSWHGDQQGSALLVGLQLPQSLCAPVYEQCT